MRRVVATGLGVVSSIGKSKAEVLRSLRENIPGIEFVPEMKELGLRCHVAGRVKGLDTAPIGKRPLQTMSDVAKYAAVATLEALEDAKLSREELHGSTASIVIGTSFGGINELTRAEQLLVKYKNPSRLGGTGVVKLMHSTVSGNLAAWLGVQGRAYAICSSSSSGLDNIGHAYELIARGVADLCLCGAAEESTWRQAGIFLDNCGGMPSSWNNLPTKACRPYDRDRAGMVPSEGAGVLLLEALEHAERRGIVPYGEIVGYGAANDGSNMFEPSGEGFRECIEEAMAAAGQQGVHRIDYINSHGSGTRLGDAVEVQVLKNVFPSSSPLVSSTKGLSGHAQAAAGAHGAIFTLLMLRHNFVAPTVNLDHIAPECAGVRHVQALTELPLATTMTLNSGLGGTNACLIFRKL